MDLVPVRQPRQDGLEDPGEAGARMPDADRDDRRPQRMFRLDQLPCWIGA
jgi:hypothetical protein